MAYKGLGVDYLQNVRIKRLDVLISGGGDINDVDVNDYSTSSTVEKFEAGTPNIIGAVSLLKAIEYIDKIWGMDKIRAHEQEQTKYALAKFNALEKLKKLELVWPYDVTKRVGVFSFVLTKLRNNTVVGEKFALKNICVRCGWHCAYPLHKFIKKAWTCRMSLYVYNDRADIDAFFTELTKMVK